MLKLLDPLPTLDEQRGRGGEEQREGCLPVEPKVKGCHGPANGDEELNTQSFSAGQG